MAVFNILDFCTPQVAMIQYITCAYLICYYQLYRLYQGNLWSKTVIYQTYSGFWIHSSQRNFFMKIDIEVLSLVTIDRFALNGKKAIYLARGGGNNNCKVWNLGRLGASLSSEFRTQPGFVSLILKEWNANIARLLFEIGM